MGDFLAACVQLRVGHGDPNRLLREVDIEFAIKDIAKAVEQLVGIPTQQTLCPYAKVGVSF